MDFLGFDITTPEGALAGSNMHRKMVHDYMGLLDRFQKLPAVEDLTYTRLKEMGYSKEFLDDQETLTCLPPPGDALYRDETSPFDLQYDELLNRMDQNQEECQQKDKEFFESLSEEEQTVARAMSMATAMVNTFFMLSLDWSQVCIIGSMPFCPPRKQLEILGHLSAATGACRSAFDRIHFQFYPCAAVQFREAFAKARITRDSLATWVRGNPAFAEALNTRIHLLDQTMDNLKVLLDYLEGRTNGLGNI